ncbi:YicC/YloC family endoribonuclease [Aquabacterium sp. A08]|uniref:YicC/YloC family endoribonuclease n=1 Tax=Aquabacterium sp. A08 TaxID=2718532 RepID=UPI00141FE47B|nr:YicC/YloC family endoribonuclease [Aquabacterium sp. A08]NIC40781.1 YicC family protein [Aquabacterium sp. A08]NIC42686.1 YicC family protein [Aquabacterium sp. A08]
MPVYSMTGYANGHSHPPAGGEPSPPAGPMLGMEIRSVNSRFLDLSFRLSDELRPGEPALRELLTARMKRGKVEVRAWIEGRQDGGLRAPSVAELQKLLALQDQVRDWLPSARELSVAEVLGTLSRSAPAPTGLGDALLALAQVQVGEFTASREREGARLAAMLLGHLAQLRALASQAQPLVPQLVELQRQRFLERWNDALGAAQSDAAASAAQERALSEATAYAIRIDVAEELTRLQSHLDEIERLLHKGGEVGKRLDFFIQELHREANTLGSKSSSLELTRISVDMKVLIEQMREQVQNLE